MVSKTTEEQKFNSAVEGIKSLTGAIPVSPNLSMELVKLRSISSNLNGSLEGLDLAWEAALVDFYSKPAILSGLSKDAAKALSNFKTKFNSAFDWHIKQLQKKVDKLQFKDLKHSTGGAVDPLVDIITSLENNLSRLSKEEHLKNLSETSINLGAIAAELHGLIDAYLVSRASIDTDLAHGLPRAKELLNNLSHMLAEIITHFGSNESIHLSRFDEISTLISSDPAAADNSLVNVLNRLSTEITSLQTDHKSIKDLAKKAGNMEKGLVLDNRVDSGDDTGHASTNAALIKISSLQLPKQRNSVLSILEKLDPLMNTISVSRNSPNFRKNYLSAISNLRALLSTLRTRLSAELDSIDEVGAQLTTISESEKTNNNYELDPTQPQSGLSTAIGTMFSRPASLRALIKDERHHYHILSDIIQNDLANVEDIIIRNIPEIDDAHAYGGESRTDAEHETSTTDFMAGWDTIRQTILTFETTVNEFETALQNYILRLSKTLKYMNNKSYQLPALTQDQKDLLLRIHRDMDQVITKLSDVRDGKTLGNIFGK